MTTVTFTDDKSASVWKMAFYGIGYTPSSTSSKTERYAGGTYEKRQQ